MASLYSFVLFVVASVVENRERVATTTSLAVPVVTLTLGLPVSPVAVLTASNGAVGLTPVNEAALSLIASVSPVTVTDMVFAPVVVATRYQISDCMPTLLVLVAFVNAPLNHPEI